MRFAVLRNLSALGDAQIDVAFCVLVLVEKRLEFLDVDSELQDRSSGVEFDLFGAHWSVDFLLVIHKSIVWTSSFCNI